MAQEQEVKVEYRRLRRRLDRMPIGAPRSKEIYEILKILFTEEQAAIGAVMPQKPAPIEEISRRTGVEAGKLKSILEKMADDGLVLDMRNPNTGETLYMLAPTVVGFFEFSLMKHRDDIDQKKLASLYSIYMFDSDVFAKETFAGHTQFGRTMVHESALRPEQLGSVMDYEKVTAMVEAGDRFGLATCYCRNKGKLTGHECKFPLELCMTVGSGADYLTRHGLARKSSKSEMLELLALARELGLIHMAENVREGASMICNCCGCHCGVLSAINLHGINHSMMTSNFIAAIDAAACKGCGLCAKRCPIQAITMRERATGEEKKPKLAKVHEEMCLGCGVCHAACKAGALSMEYRKERVLTPENTIDCFISMALERGKLGNLIFDDENRADHWFLRRFTAAVAGMPPAKQLMLNDQLRSRFVKFLMDNVPGGRG